MGRHSDPTMVARPTYASGKRLAEQIFLDALAAIGVRYAMLQKLKPTAFRFRFGGRLACWPLAKPPTVWLRL
jgi:hypothetical protein